MGVSQNLPGLSRRLEPLTNCISLHTHPLPGDPTPPIPARPWQYAAASVLCLPFAHFCPLPQPHRSSSEEYTSRLPAPKQIALLTRYVDDVKETRDAVY